MQLGSYFDQSRCSGCFTCIVACKDWHDIPPGPVSWIRLETTEQGQFPDVSVRFLIHHCYHCAEPPCVAACPTGAVVKIKENGIVTVHREDCLGMAGCGGACRTACPYGAPQFGSDPDARMEKCDLCLDRWQTGKKPVCVEACPTRALDAGPLHELQSRYPGGARPEETMGFVANGPSKPSIIIKPKT